MTVRLSDGTTRTGYLKARSRRSFTLDDSIWSISYEDVEEIIDPDD
jgi:hypothetical protein